MGDFSLFFGEPFDVLTFRLLLREGGWRKMRETGKHKH